MQLGSHESRDRQTTRQPTDAFFLIRSVAETYPGIASGRELGHNPGSSGIFWTRFLAFLSGRMWRWRHLLRSEPRPALLPDSLKEPRQLQCEAQHRVVQLLFRARVELSHLAECLGNPRGTRVGYGKRLQRLGNTSRGRDDLWARRLGFLPNSSQSFWAN
jgi:hypothetical protein